MEEFSQFSPVLPDFRRCVKYDEDGAQHITYEPFDGAAVLAANGTVDMWSLNSLLAAGINPNFSISTGLGTRIEGLDSIHDFESVADEILSATDSEDDSTK